MAVRNGNIVRFVSRGSAKLSSAYFGAPTSPWNCGRSNGHAGSDAVASGCLPSVLIMLRSALKTRSDAFHQGHRRFVCFSQILAVLETDSGLGLTPEDVATRAENVQNLQLLRLARLNFRNKDRGTLSILRFLIPRRE